MGFADKYIKIVHTYVYFFKSLQENMKKVRREIREIRENQRDFLNLKNTISEMKTSLHGINSRLDSNSKQTNQKHQYDLKTAIKTTQT